MKNGAKLKAQVSLWIEVVLDDLVSSNILYRHKHYRMSYFVFHQSVEKANKALAVFNGKTDEDLRDYSHNEIKIYKPYPKDRERKILELNTLLDLFPKMTSHKLFDPLDLKEYSKSLDTAINEIANVRNLDLINISHNDIQYLLHELYEIKSASIRLPDKPDMGFIEMLRKSIDWIGLLETPEATAFQKEYDLFINTKGNWPLFYKVIKENLKIIQTLSFVLTTFFVCAVFTMQHGVSARYPPTKNSNPLKIYTRRLPLVRNQLEIMDVFINALLALRDVINTSGINK